ncbi:MFS transporter [Komagataeibacter oboediens]|uniref:MFS transporter n=1 Tax=Komagataeibacter oboediens TaxID=65958 RepID=UPI0019C22F5D|nr:MFS transporter [Komagataeibacter oboediens]GCE81747.1 major facilitator transporter [Komagataeibacter oboediens]
MAESKDTNSWATTIAAATGYAMDGFDFLILAFSLPAIAQEFHLGPTAGASLATSTLVGAVLGGMIFGILADRYGRIRILTWTIVCFAVFTAVCALAPGYPFLLVARFLSGLGLGGEFGIGMALVSEAWPRGKTDIMSAFVAIGGQVGVILAVFCVTLLMPVIGWRGLFLVGAFPAILAAIFRQKLHDPIRIETGQGNSAFSFRYFIESRDLWRTSLGIAILCIVQNCGYYGIIVWMPQFLSHRLHLSLQNTGIWTVVMLAGMSCGMYTFGLLSEKFRHKTIFVSYMIGAMVTTLLYPHLTGPTAFLVGGAILGFFVNGMLGGYAALISRRYPVKIRATAQNMLFNIGRAVGGFSPVIVSNIDYKFGFYTTISLFSLLYIIDIISISFIIPETE